MPTPLKHHLSFLLMVCILGCGESNTWRNAIPDKHTTYEEYSASPLFITPVSANGIIELTHDFIYVNNSGLEHKLTMHETTCGCTRVKIHPDTVMPGQTATISISYDLSYSRVIRSETVVIETGLENLGQLIYTLSAETYPYLEIDKANLADFVCEPGKTQTIKIMCRSYMSVADEDSGPLMLRTDHPLARVEPDRLLTCKITSLEGIKKTESQFLLSLTCPDANSSDFRNDGYWANLKLENNKYCLEKQYHWIPQQYIHPDMEGIFFNCLYDAFDKEIVVYESDQPFAIRSIEVKNALCSVKCDLNEKSKWHSLEISRIKDILAITKEKDEITIITDHPLQKYIYLSVDFLLPLTK